MYDTREFENVSWVRSIELEYELHHLPVLYGAFYLNSLYYTFIICKMGKYLTIVAAETEKNTLNVIWKSMQYSYVIKNVNFSQPARTTM